MKKLIAAIAIIVLASTTPVAAEGKSRLPKTKVRVITDWSRREYGIPTYDAVRVIRINDTWTCIERDGEPLWCERVSL